MTQTPGWTDVKMHLRRCFYSDYGGGMGRREKTKTLTPYHYGDALEDPWRTRILLRAWALQRARQRGWAAARDGRQREAARQADDLCRDIRESSPDGLSDPLLGHRDAHALLKKWIPREVETLLTAA